MEMRLAYRGRERCQPKRSVRRGARRLSDSDSLSLVFLVSSLTRTDASCECVEKRGSNDSSRETEPKSGEASTEEVKTGENVEPVLESTGEMNADEVEGDASSGPDVIFSRKEVKRCRSSDESCPRLCEFLKPSVPDAVVNGAGTDVEVFSSAEAGASAAQPPSE